MKNRLSLFVLIFSTALLFSISLIELFTRGDVGVNPADGLRGAALDAVRMSSLTFVPIDEAVYENDVRYDSSDLMVEPGVTTSLLTFEISGISGAVEKATLYVTQRSVAGDGTLAVLGGSHASGGVQQLGSLTSAFENSQVYAIDLHGIEGDGIYTIILEMEEGGSEAWFHSREGAEPPRLEVVTRAGR